MKSNRTVRGLITQTQAAEIRDVSLTAIRDLIRRGRLDAVTIAGCTFLRRALVLRFKRLPGGRPRKP
jgi:hypothetical protein